MKKVLFLAPSMPYAKTVVKNACEELDRKKIGYGVSESVDYLAFQTDNVKVELIWLDPIEWTASTFYKLDAVFGKRELVNKAREKMFHLGAMFPKTSFINYILECEAGLYPKDEAESKTSYIPSIKNVYFNDPMTIVIWEDGTKTMVKCQEDDVYSEEAGLALCIAKKSLGNKGNFNNVFRKWCPESKPSKINADITPAIAAEAVNDYMDKLRDEILAKTRRFFK